MIKNDFVYFVSFILVILLISILCITPSIFIFELFESYQNEPIYYKKYEVIDYNNNNTIAYNCSDMKCELKDGTILSVKQYKHVGSEYIGIRKDIEMR